MSTRHSSSRSRNDRQEHMGGVLWIMKDLLLCDAHGSGSRKRFATAQIAVPARKSPAGDLNPQAMSPLKTIGRRPQLDVDLETPIALGHRVTRCEALESITDIHRLARWLHITEAHKEIGMFQTRTHKQFRRDWSDDFQIAFQGRTGKRQNVRASF